MFELLMGIKFPEKCECDPKDTPLYMSVFQYISEGKNRCVRCKRLKE